MTDSAAGRQTPIAGHDQLVIALRGAVVVCVAGWQVFKQLVLEGRSGTNQQVSPAADTAAAAQAAGDTSSSHGGSKPVVDADAGPGSSSQVQALQDQLRKLRLQVG